MHEQPENYLKLLNDEEGELNLKCKMFIKLSRIIRLFQIKVFKNWRDKSVTTLLSLLNQMLLRVRYYHLYSKRQKYIYML